MKLTTCGSVGRLRHKFPDAPAGYGRPIPTPALDHEYRSGSWAHFRELLELARQSIIVGAVNALYPNPSIFDLGYGSRRCAQPPISHAFGRYFVGDISTKGLGLDRELKLSRCEFLQRDFETWRPVAKFDVSMMSECIGYLRDLVALTAAFAGHLAPGGMVVVSQFRFRHSQTHRRRVERRLASFDRTTVTNIKNQTWDIGLLRPRN